MSLRVSLRPAVLVLLLGTGLSVPVHGQATLVKDIRPGGTIMSRSIDHLVGGPERVYFVADEEELWTSDGTVAGTRLVSAAPRGFLRELVLVGSTLFFPAEDAGGYELWKSDGSAAGTMRVKDINPGNYGSRLSNLTEVGGTLFFVADDGTHGPELWKSDGTEAGTVLVKDICPSSCSFLTPAALTDVNGTLFFVADDGSTGTELWKSDGTAAGTVRVADINPGAQGSMYVFPQPTNVNGRLFFVAADGTRGARLWTSDGVTTQIVDTTPGTGDQLYDDLVDFNGVLYFGSEGWLWRSDGTPAGTVAVAELRVEQLAVVGATLFISAYHNPEGVELWKSDGTAAGTVLVKDIRGGPLGSSPSGLRNVNGVLFFSADDGVTGYDLWKSDGTGPGTVRVLDGPPGPLPPSSITASLGLAFFAAGGPSGPQLWRSDGTAGGTLVLTSSFVPASSDIYEPPVALGNLLLFAAEDGLTEVHLWKSDGTGPGTTIVKDINPGGSSGAAHLTLLGGRAYFGAFDGSAGGLWSTDGTAGGTTRVSAAAPAVAGMIAVGSTLYFDAIDDSHGDELWKSDGTTAGTMLVKDINPGPVWSFPGGFTNLGGTLFFVATTPAEGTELWKSDGTGAGTVLVKDIYPGPESSTPRAFTVVGSTLLFVALHPDYGLELWKSDGTAAGTVLVKDFWPGAISGIYDFDYYREDPFVASLGGMLFLAAADPVHGRELWKSDGTAAGTVLVKDLRSGADSSDPRHLTASGGRLFFVASQEATGYELWTSDGTAGGTTLVMDLMPGPPSSSPYPLHDIDGVLFFAANHPAAGNEVWRSDGSAAGTVLAADVAPGATPSYPGFFSGFTRAGERLFFAASHPEVGRELWTMPLGRALAVADIAVNEGTGGAAQAVFNVTLSASSNSAVSVDYATAAGTATSPADFAAVSGTLTFAPGVTNRTITVTVAADALDEADETFFLNLSSPTGALLADAQAVAVIEDDDGPSASVADVSVTEGSVGPTAAVLSVILSAPAAQTVSIDYAASAASAAVPADFASTTGRLHFLPGTTRLDLTVPVVADRLDEFDETFVVNLSNPQNATLADGQATVTIVDDDAPPVLSLSDVTLLEGNQGTRTATLMASLSAPSGKTIGVQFTTRDGTASAGSDYAAAAGSLSFAPGATSRPVAVTVNGDTTVEPDETFFVDLSNPVEVTLGDATGSATVLDDDLGRGFHPVAPCRLVDTRQPAGPSGGPALAANSSRSFPVAGVCNVPPAARAVVVNVVAVNPGAAGNLRLHPAGSATPNASVLNFRAGRTRAGNGIATLGAGGEIAVRCDMPPGSTAASHLVLDVYGYFE